MLDTNSFHRKDHLYNPQTISGLLWMRALGYVVFSNTGTDALPGHFTSVQTSGSARGVTWRSPRWNPQRRRWHEGAKQALDSHAKTRRNLKCRSLDKEPGGKGHLPYSSSYRTFWKREDRGDSRQSSGDQGLERGLGRNEYVQRRGFSEQ